ncbi:MAG: formyltransferase family protein [Kiritimatiellia bacterium]
MRIAFFSEDNFGLAVLERLVKEHTIVFVVSPYFSNPTSKRLERWCARNQLMYVRARDVNGPVVMKGMRETHPDLLVSVHFSKLLRREIYQLPRLGAINLHPSLLPKYRGMSPQHWPIINGEKETGITVHFIADQADTGAIVRQIKVPILSEETVFDLQRRMLPIYCDTVSDAVAAIAKGERGAPQEGESGIYYGKFQPEFAIINLRQGKQQVFDLVRAITRPYKGAFFAGRRIWKVSFMSAEEERVCMAAYARCGIVEEALQVPFLRLLDGCLRIDEMTVEERDFNERTSD